MMQLTAVLLPAFIDLINRKIADSDTRFWVSVLVCSIVGIFFNWIDTGFIFATMRDGAESISSSILIVFGIAQLVYKATWENSKLRERLNLNS